MESKNIKVIDEHGIDRDANLILSMDVDGSDYAIYWIERDSENDNIFVSKLIKNLDNTSNMINIEDSMEKSKIVEIVKELIKYSIDNENDKLSANSVVLPSGKTVDFSSVIINKEQNINVQKTYITTVKKSVVKVTSEYYDVKVSDSVVGEIAPEIFPVTGQTEVLPSESEVQPVIPVVEPTPIEIPKVVEPVVVPVITEGVSSLSTSKVTESVSPVEPVVPSNIQQVVEPTAEIVASEITMGATENQEVIQPVVQPPLPSQVVAEPVISEMPQPVVETPENALVFDASKEINLNSALGEVSQESTIPVENVSSIREFGDETPKVEPTVVSTTEVVNNTSVAQPETRSKAGFAHNKFFMVVAIAFFLASCIFLGYEVFNYFQIK